MTFGARRRAGAHLPGGRAAFEAAYRAALAHWPEPYQELEVPTRFGETHVIASGPASAAPIVLLHGYGASATM